jgi:hypothetical protein
MPSARVTDDFKTAASSRVQKHIFSKTYVLRSESGFGFLKMKRVTYRNHDTGWCKDFTTAMTSRKVSPKKEKTS